MKRTGNMISPPDGFTMGFTFLHAADLHLDGIISGDALRQELLHRFAFAEKKRVVTFPRKRPVTPV